ncbi:MAG: hypothetical protein ACI8RE_002751 [Ilumatobacter sp.]|jgi:hypothetical protein
MVVMMTVDQSPMMTFDAFFLDEFPRLVAMLTAWTGSRAIAEYLGTQTEAHYSVGETTERGVS